MQRINAGVTALQGKIYVLGGWDGESGLSTVTRVRPAGHARSAGLWQPLAEMAVARECPGVGVLLRGAGRSLRGGIYAVGGAWGTQYHRSVEVYDVRRSTWDAVAAMNVQRCGPGVATTGGALYAVGGMAQPPGHSYMIYHSSVEKYNPVADEWSFVAPMSTPRAKAGVAVVDGLLYACGGFSGQTYHNSVEAFDPASGSWHEAAPMSTARSGPGVAVANGLLYAVGGSTSSHYLSSAERFDPRTPAGWSPIASMGALRACLGVAEILGELYAVGGSDDAARSSSACSVSRYDARADRWDAVVALTKDRLLTMAEKNLCHLMLTWAPRGHRRVRARTRRAYQPWAYRADVRIARGSLPCGLTTVRTRRAYWPLKYRAPRAPGLHRCNPLLFARAWRSLFCCCCTGTGGKEEPDEQLVELLSLPSLPSITSPRSKVGTDAAGWTGKLPAPSEVRV